MSSRRTLRRRVGAVAAGGAMALALPGCSYDGAEAVTINEDGDVIVVWCIDGPPVIGVSPAGAVLRFHGDTTEVSEVNLSAPGDGWTITGDLEVRDDSTISLWSDWEYDRLVAQASTPVSSTVATTAATTATTAARYVQPPPAPMAVVRVSDLRVGRYLHEGQLISAGKWRDVCDPDDGIGSFVTLAIAGMACVGLCLFALVWGIITLVSRPRRGPPEHNSVNPREWSTGPGRSPRR